MARLSQGEQDRRSRLGRGRRTVGAVPGAVGGIARLKRDVSPRPSFCPGDGQTPRLTNAKPNGFSRHAKVPPIGWQAKLRPAMSPGRLLLS